MNVGEHTSEGPWFGNWLCAVWDIMYILSDTLEKEL